MKEQWVSAAVLKKVNTTSCPKGGVSILKQVVGIVFIVAMSMASGIETAQANAKYAGIVVDAKSGKVLYSEDADGLRYPASLTKMMTLYLTFEALEARRISLDSKVMVSAHAASEPPSKLGVKAGGSVTVEQAILALVTRSANDIATALGEKLGGNEARFAQMMTAKARALGMTRTTYRNANGLPNTAQMTTARDQARLGIALRQHFPQYYSYFSTRAFQYGRQTIGNHNRLVGSVRGVDGIKTGYTNAAGFNLVTSAQLDGRSIVGVVLGGTSGGARDAQMRRLVATYLPKASQGGSSELVAQVRAPARPPIASVPVPVEPSSPPASLAVVEDRMGSARALPTSGPVPSGRYEEKLPGASAYLSEPKQQSAAAAVDAAMSRQTVRPRAPMPPAEIPREVSELTPPVKTDSVTTSSTRPSTPSESDKSGWVIQIGVSPDRDSAMDLLHSAQDKGGQVLRSAKPFAVAVNGGSGQMYRARFAGFDDQKSAVNACNILKKKGVQCWASLQ